MARTPQNIENEEIILSGKLVEVRTKAGIGRNTGHKKNMFSCRFSITLPCKRDFLTVQGDFDKIIDVVRRKVCFLTV